MRKLLQQRDGLSASPGPAVGVSEGGRLAVFLGTTPNIGATVASFGTAAAMARLSGRSVGYLCLNLKSSKLHRYLGRNETPFGLNQLRADLKSRSLTRQRLLQSCDRFSGLTNLSVLFGSTLREQAEFLQPDDVSHLLKTARATFDLCLVEVNAYWDNAATVQTLLEADERLLVTTPDITHFQEDRSRWLGSLSPLFGLDLEPFRLVVSQAEKPSLTGGIGWRDIEKETGLPVWAQIAKRDEVLAHLNQGKLLELLRQPVFAEVFQGLARTCLQGWGVDCSHAITERRRLFRFMPRTTP
ncbi:hypothetical protein [Paenibacillus sp. J31TS4]|uniref:AAA family ATPase n=1 Tax=Paenibacillus sp. J31TS4 TaxID=2807195 RepID=UPI001BCBEE78|nr:hypothetical protein [Paenibacillus sp. J31TS4]